jgi:hypothetical protein
MEIHKGSGICSTPRRGILILALSLVCLAACRGPLKQADLEEFIETGLTNVLLRSSSFDAGSGSLSRIPSGKAVTCNVVIINPKSFNVTYSLGWNIDGSAFTTAPSAAPTPADATHLNFSFVPNPARAEHKTITFSLGKYVATINKTYDPEYFSILCDSPPNPATRVATLTEASSQKSQLAVLLPTETSDDDLSQLKITWSREGSTATETNTYAISSLKAPLSPNPFASAYDCYFQSSDCVAGYGYAYSVVVVDAAGQESSAVSTSGTANLFYLNYDGNGNTGGSAPASVGYRFAATATVASPGSLAKSAYVFDSWNTAADGSGTKYSPGDTLTIPAGELTLYARWYTNGVGVTFDLGSQALVFNPSAVTLTQGIVLNAGCTNATLNATPNWTWYIDGSVIAGQTTSALAFPTTGVAIGSHTISCIVTYNGLRYSGHFTLTVTN